MSVLKKLLGGTNSSRSRIHPTNNSEISQDSENSQSNVTLVGTNINYEAHEQELKERIGKENRNEKTGKDNGKKR